MTNPKSEDAVVQHWCAPNDGNGNPRRAYVIWGKDGSLNAVIDEGYSGKPARCRDLMDLGDVRVSPSEYRAILKGDPELA